MPELEYTEAPWTRASTAKGWAVMGASREGLLPRVADVGEWEDTCLMAASPDLYEAGKLWQNALTEEEYYEAFGAVSVAIAKAEGGTTRHGATAWVNPHKAAAAPDLLTALKRILDDHLQSCYMECPYCSMGYAAIAKAEGMQSSHAPLSDRESPAVEADSDHPLAALGKLNTAATVPDEPEGFGSEPEGWYVDRSRNWDGRQDIRHRGTNQIVTRISTWIDKGDLAKMLAAPDMLDALVAIRECTFINRDKRIDRPCVDCVEKVAAAIAKAKGTQSSHV